MYIQQAKMANFGVVGYCFVTDKEAALARNALRNGRARVPDVAIRTMYSQLEYPELDEGFDELYFVRLTDGGFSMEPYDENYTK